MKRVYSRWYEQLRVSLEMGEEKMMYYQRRQKAHLTKVMGGHFVWIKYNLKYRFDPKKTGNGGREYILLCSD